MSGGFVNGSQKCIEICAFRIVMKDVGYFKCLFYMSDGSLEIAIVAKIISHIGCCDIYGRLVPDVLCFVIGLDSIIPTGGFLFMEINHCD